ncbi:hypothetical protein OB920_15645 [Halobacteria archaeon HArc-gm2]|nr:hypothetical protein [Halobacteria archaeon HArc-gm2]
MQSDHENQAIGAAIVDFEQSLAQLILESFAEGVPVEDSWDITVPVGDAPDWTVTIEKTYPAEESSYQPEFLKE